MSLSALWQLARLSLTAGWMILVLLALRPMLKKIPRKFSCLLWALVAVRLAFPFSLESRVSLVPPAAAAPQQIVQTLPAAQQVWVTAPAQTATVSTAAAAASAGIAWTSLLPVLWIAGIAVMLLYAAVSFYRLHRQVRISAPAGKRVYVCDSINTPFILGIVNPKIYLPSDLDESTAASVLAHERAHLRRGDHLWKPLGYLLLSIYWFNPLCWVAYLLFCRDVEQACDEAVIRSMNPQQKKNYSAALLACATARSVRVCPLAFAEVGVKQRITGILNYRKPKFWVVALSLVLCVTLTAGLLTDPVKATKTEGTASQSTNLNGPTCILSNAATLYSTPNSQGTPLAELAAGTSFELYRLEQIDDATDSPYQRSKWMYVHCPQQELDGWIQCAGINLNLAMSSFFLGCMNAWQEETPEHVMEYLCFADDSEKEQFRSTYTPLPDFVFESIIDLKIEMWGASIRTAEGQRFYLIDNRDGGLYITPLDMTEDELPGAWRQLLADNALAATDGTATVGVPLNVRKKPSLSSPVIAMLETGTQVRIMRTQSVDGITWARISCDEPRAIGWVVAEYLNTAEGDTSPTVSAAAAPATPSTASDGTVTVTAKGAVDLYASPSVKSRVVFQLEDGSPVTIFRIDSIGELSWAYVQSVDLDRPGWIPVDSLNTENVDLSIYDAAPVATPTVPLPAQLSSSTLTEEISATTKEALTLYVSPSLNARTKGELAQGEPVTIIRIDAIGQAVWAYIRSDTLDATGWVLASSFDVDGGTFSIPSVNDLELLATLAEKERNSDSYRNHIDKLDEIIADYISKYGTSQVLTESTPAVVSVPLNVRSEPDLKSSVVTMLETGAQVGILHSETKDGTTWAYISFDGANATGWVMAEYLSTSEDSAAVPQDTEESTPATVSGPLNVRSAPSVSSSAIAMLETGTQVRILYSENVNGTIWARISCDEPSVIGWVVAEYLNTSENEIAPTDSGSPQFPDDEAEYNAVVESLLAFANPTQVQVIYTLGWEPAADRQPLSFKDAVCSTDTWHFAESDPDLPAQCMIVLTAKDGSVARIWNADGTIHIAHPDGTTEVCMSGFQGDELLNMVYDWAKAKG